MRGEIRDLKKDARRIIRAFALLNKAKENKHSFVEVFDLSNEDLRGLKKKYLKKEKKFVDVLSFPEDSSFPDPNRPKGLLGEIYINEEVVAGDTKRARQLLIHGILHLLGYRHETKRDTIEMEKLEDRLFSTLF